MGWEISTGLRLERRDWQSEMDMAINKLRAVVCDRALLRAKKNHKYLWNENIFVNIKELGWYDTLLVIKLRGILLNMNNKP